MKSKIGFFIFTFFSLFLSLSTSAFCVYNNSSISIYGQDDRKEFWNNYWSDTDLVNHDYTCCASSQKSCDHAVLDISRSYREGGESGPIPTNPYCPKLTLHNDSAVITVTGDEHAIQCNVS